MNNGGGEAIKESQISKNKKKKSVSGVKTDEFVQGIARVAIAQICESLGFQGFQQSALGTLSDVAVRYIQEIGKIASASGNLAGRTECNVFDVIHGLEDVSSGLGFLGGSNVHRCLVGSGTVKEIIRYVGEAEEIPFAFALPGFPIVKGRKLSPSFVQTGENPPGEHIPKWLPIYPDSDTYLEKQSENEGEGESKVDRNEQVEEHNKADGSLLNLQRWWACNGFEAAAAIEPGDVSKAKRVVESNPFLAPPVQFGEEEVSPIVHPANVSEEGSLQHQNSLDVTNHVSVLEAFAPAIEAAESRLSELGEDVQKAVPNRRKSIQLSFRSRRKSLYTELKGEGFEKITSWFSNDSGKDEKKRRVEEIIYESMES